MRIRFITGENTIKEAKEEAGVDIAVDSLIAVQDRAKHNTPLYAYGIVKIFYLCRPLGGEFSENLETIASEYYSMKNLPELDPAKYTAKQIEMCFDAYYRDNWVVQFD